MVIRHKCNEWVYAAGMATCPHGFELLPSGETRRPTLARWRSHRKMIGQPTEVLAPSPQQR